MYKYIIPLLLASFVMTNSVKSQSQDNLLQLSVDFLNALKTNSSTEDCKNILANISLDELSSQINSDEKRLAFWINIYNAFIIDILNGNPDLYQDRGAFFKAKQMIIAGREVSFDDLEHGIIRRSVSKYSLGYIGKIFVPKFERKLRMEKRDPRVHFALNCGAKSCPQVAIYNDEQIYEQLDIISSQFLNNTSTYIKEESLVKVTPLISWFRADFGGIDGAKKYLKKYGIIDTEDVKLEFTDYDWTILLFNFTDLSLEENN